MPYIHDWSRPPDGGLLFRHGPAAQLIRNGHVGFSGFGCGSAAGYSKE
jgi:hypothetical protein